MNGIPTEPLGPVENPDRPGYCRDQAKDHEDCDKRQQVFESPQPEQRSQRVEFFQLKLVLARRPAFRQCEKRNKKIETIEQRRRQERRAKPPGTHDTADHRADDEARAHHRADCAKPLRTLSGWRDIGDVGARDGHIGAGYSRNRSSHNEHPAQRRKAHDKIIDECARKREQQNGTPPEPIAERAENG